LVFGLFEHLNNCVLMRPNLQEYLLQLVNDKACNLRIVDAVAFVEIMGSNAPMELKDLAEALARKKQV